MSSADLAFVFPGQGAQRPEMLEGLSWHPSFAERYATVAAALGEDPFRALREDDSFLARNVVSSLLTVLASSVAWSSFLDDCGETAAAVTGYSVGQWTALHVAGCLTFAELVEVVVERAACLDAAAALASGGMLAVIGLAPEVVHGLCIRLRAAGHPIYVSNENCHGQCTLAGTVAAIESARDEVASLRAKKIARLPVAGAWHCPLMAPATIRFRDWLSRRPLALARIPVVSNVTGQWLPRDRTAATEELAEHLSSPVRWSRCVQTLIAAGSRRCVELGFGTMLTRFGFFIDRSIEHRAYSGGRTP